MGCDIHCWAERRVNGVWTSIAQPKRDPRWPDEPASLDDFWDNRSYNVFSILADVRNGRGFAGIRTGDGFVPISQPKGLPVDVSSEVATESERWGCDGHSHSWLTLTELLAYDWTQTTKLCGWVSGTVYQDWNNWGRARGDSPESWCGDISGGFVKKVSEAEMKQLIEIAVTAAKGMTGSDWRKVMDDTLAGYHTFVEWEQPYWKAAQGFFGEVIPRMLALGKPEDVRLVFFFDN